MKLAVIQTCGWCSEYIGSRADGGKCLHPSAPQSNAVRNNIPPAWCPLRTGPDEERLAALEAVAEAAGKAVLAHSYWMLSPPAESTRRELLKLDEWTERVAASIRRLRVGGW